MTKRKSFITTLAAVVLLAVGVGACTDEESDLGIGLVDPSTFFEGEHFTLYPDAAWSKIEDTLRTSNYSAGVVGTLDDPVFGRVSSVIYTQIALPSNASSINFDEVVIDSVVLTLEKSQLYPDTAATYNLRFEVRQLAEVLSSDSVYYSTSELPVDESTLFFDSVLSVGPYDTLVRMKLDGSIRQVLSTTASAEGFIEHTKGLRIKVTDGVGMMGVNFASAKTCLTAYYHYGTAGSSGSYTFLMGAGASHFTQFVHNYSGTAVAGADSVGGANRLYLEALGGFAVHIGFDRDIKAFHAAHPTAVVQYAELLLPLAPEANSMTPDLILAMTPNALVGWAGVADLTEAYTIAGYDGTYDSDNNRYRLRIPRHVQQGLRNNADAGMLLLLEARRHVALSTVFYGIADTATSPKIRIIYSE